MFVRLKKVGNTCRNWRIMELYPMKSLVNKRDFTRYYFRAHKAKKIQKLEMSRSQLNGSNTNRRHY